MSSRTASPALSSFAAPVVLLLLITLSGGTVAQAQTTPLAQKLRSLNVRLTTEHYRLAGTVSDDRLAMYGRALEYIHREYERGFRQVIKDYDKRRRTSAGKEHGKRKGRSRRSSRKGKTTGTRRGSASTAAPAEGENTATLADEDQAERFPVIVFRTRREYEDFGRLYLASSEYTNGMYVPSVKLLLILDQGNFDDTCEVLFHEAFHQFLRKYVKNPPLWLNEGLATHYGFARATRNGLTFRNPPDHYWRLVRKLIRRKQHIPLWNIVNATRAEFYSKVPVHVSGYDDVRLSSIYYAEAYTLIHTLLYDRTGKARLQQYLRELARDDGTNTDAITRKYFGPDVCDHMTPFWIKHVNSRPETR